MHRENTYTKAVTIEKDMGHEYTISVPFWGDTMSLKHKCRMVLRKEMLKLDPHQSLFQMVPRLSLPSIIVKYLLFNVPDLDHINIKM